MRFRFLLTHIVEGDLEITEPDSWKEATLKLERDENFHSLIEYFEGSFIFYGNNGIVNGGIDFIKNIERTYGVDETIEIAIDITFDEIIFSPVFTGQFKFSELEEMMNNKMRLPIIRDDFWSKFIARKDTPVDLQAETDLDGLAITPVEKVITRLTSQMVRSLYQGENKEVPLIFDVAERWDIPANEFGIIDFPTTIRDEIEEKFSLPITESPTRPVNLFEVTYGGEYQIDFSMSVWSIIMHSAAEPATQFEFSINNNTPIIMTRTDIGTPGIDRRTEFTYSDTVTLIAGDQLRFYIRNTSGSLITVIQPKKSIYHSYLNIIADTIFPETKGESFLIHDTAAAILKSYGLGVENPFYSELLGSLLTRARQYDDEGCGWRYSLSKGLQLRLYSLAEKPFFQSFSQWWAGINPILNLGLGYDSIDTDPVIRVEGKSYFYLNEISIYFSNVRQITRKYDNDRIFNKVSIGYTRWQAEDISGIDDPQSRKTYSTRLQKVGKNIDLHSEFIGASLAIETTRRTTKEKSADYKYDNEVFIIALNPDEVIESPEESPDLVHFRPELDENFSSVTNLLNSETRYNLKLTAGRNFLRWQNYVQGGLQSYLGSVFKFTSAEGNYGMTSQMDVNGCLNEDFDGNLFSEKGDVPVTDDFIHLADLYEAEVPMEWEEYEVIRDNRRKAIGISLTDVDHVPMFIKTLEYKPVKGTCSLLLWAKEYLDLYVTPDSTPMQECQPMSAECEDALTDENGNILTDELGVCITE